MKSTVAKPTDSFSAWVELHVDDVAPAERRVAESLLELGPEASLLSAAALAERLGTSDATIVRTAKALGYSGLAELRRALVAHTRDPSIDERLQRSLEQAPRSELFAATIGNHLAAIETLTRNVSAERFERATALLGASRRIVWRGVGPSAYLAVYGQLLGERIGKPSAALVHTGTSFADELLGLAPGDCVVVLAYGRLQSHVRVLLERCATLEVPVLLITDTLGHKLGAEVDTTLECGRGAPGSFASHGPTLVLIEALVLAVAAGDRDAAQETLATLNDLRAALAGRRLDVDMR